MNHSFGLTTVRRGRVSSNASMRARCAAPFRASAMALMLWSGLAHPLPGAQPPVPPQGTERAAERARLLALADEARAGQAANPGDARLRMAGAKYRLLAALLGDTPLAEADLAAAKAVRTDRSLPARERLELAALEDQNRRKGRRFTSPEEYWREREASARALLAEFPELPDAHTHLLAVAQGAPAAASLRLAQEIAVSNAPAEVRARARELIVRASIDGRNLHEVLGAVPGTAAILGKVTGRPVILYAWAPQDAPSIARARQLAAALPAGAVAFGVNLGPDVGGALAMAAAQGLPGEQLYGGRGFDSPLVRELALTLPGMVYAANAEGVLRNFTGWRDAAEVSAHLK